MEFRTIQIGHINPAPYNPRVDLRPGDPRYDKLRRSLDEFGLVEPLVWNQRTGNLVGGHQRLKVLIETGHAEAPVVVVDLPEDKEKALNVALNKIGGDWDETKLAELLSELTETPDFDIDITGFESDEADDLIAEMLGGGDGGDEDFDQAAALEAAGPPVTRCGEIIQLGTDPDRCHFLMCADATDPANVRALMGGHRATLFATDPPYLVDYDAGNHPGGSDRGGEFGWDASEGNLDLYKRFTRVAVDHALSPRAAWYCWHASRRQMLVEQAWNEAGAFVHCQIIWDKTRGVPTRTWYLWQHEPCLMGWVRGNRPRRVERRRLPTVWRIETLLGDEARPDHPTPKPLELFEWPMRQHTHLGDVCYEPFAGSGPQFIAAERQGRRCFGLELEPAYCDLIVRRFIAFAGEDAVGREVAERYRLPDPAAGENEEAA